MRKIFPVFVSDEYNLAAMIEQQKKAILLSQELSTQFNITDISDISDVAVDKYSEKGFSFAKKMGNMAGELTKKNLGFTLPLVTGIGSIIFHCGIALPVKRLSKKVQDYVMVNCGYNDSQYIIIKLRGKNSFSTKTEEICFKEAVHNGWIGENCNFDPALLDKF